MVSFSEEQEYLNFRKTEYVSDLLTDKIDALCGCRTHSGWKIYNFILVLQVLDLVPDYEMDP